MSSLHPANRSLVQQRVLLRGVGAACGLYNCKIEKEKKTQTLFRVHGRGRDTALLSFFVLEVYAPELCTMQGPALPLATRTALLA